MKFLFALFVTLVSAQDEATLTILKSLYSSTGGDNWINKTGWGSSTSACTWFGVVCQDGTETVSEIILHSNNLNGVVPANFASLTLDTCDLGGNPMLCPNLWAMVYCNLNCSSSSVTNMGGDIAFNNNYAPIFGGNTTGDRTDTDNDNDNNNDNNNNNNNNFNHAILVTGSKNNIQLIEEHLTLNLNLNSNGNSNGNSGTPTPTYIWTPTDVQGLVTGILLDLPMLQQDDFTVTVNGNGVINRGSKRKRSSSVPVTNTVPGPTNADSTTVTSSILTDLPTGAPINTDTTTTNQTNDNGGGGGGQQQGGATNMGGDIAEGNNYGPIYNGSTGGNRVGIDNDNDNNNDNNNNHNNDDIEPRTINGDDNVVTTRVRHINLNLDLNLNVNSNSNAAPPPAPSPAPPAP